MLSIPAILLAVLTVAVLGPGFIKLIMVLGLTRWPRYTRVAFGQTLQVATLPFIRAAEMAGSGALRILLRHVLRPASASLVTVAGLSFGYLFGGSIIVESFYSLPGIGLLASQAVYNKDIPILQGVVVCVAVVFVIVNSLVDLSYGLLDPRVRTAR